MKLERLKTKKNFKVYELKEKPTLKSHTHLQFVTADTQVKNRKRATKPKHKNRHKILTKQTTE